MDEDKNFDEAQPFLEHLEDLRTAIIRCVTVLGISIILACFFMNEIIWLLKVPLLQVLEPRGEDPDKFLKTLGVVEPLSITIQAGLLAGLIVSMPFLFFFIGQFLLPALTAQEKMMLLPVFFAGGFLFLGGVVFSYFLVLPVALEFFFEFNDWLGSSAEWTLQNYISFVVHMMIAFGVSFELPLVIIILAKLGLVTREFLSNYRRHAIVAILVVSACITPTSDPYTLGLLFFPMYILFEISVFITGFIEQRHIRALESD